MSYPSPSIAQVRPITKTALEYLANLLICAACGMVLWTQLGREGLFSKRPHRPDPSGARISAPARYEWSSRPLTLVLAVRGGCVFCGRSVPFYRRLAQFQREGRLRADLLVVTPPERPGKRTALASIQARTSTLDSLQQWNVQGTPTLLLVNSQGKVEKAWIGQLTSAEEQDVISASLAKH